MYRAMLSTSFRSYFNKTGVINDPLGQTHNPIRSDHNSHLKMVLFYAILKRGEGRRDM